MLAFVRAVSLRRALPVLRLSTIPPVVAPWAAANAAVAAALVACTLAQGRALTGTWTRWDGGWFRHIADHGYGDRPGSPAFYPLYPAVQKALGAILGGNEAAAAVVISLAASLGALELLRRFTAARYGERAGLRAAWVLALFPFALFLQLAYSESLYLLLALGTAVALQRGRFLLAGNLAGLALLTRPVAVALVVAIATVALRRRQLRDGAAAVATASAWFALYPLLLVQQGRSWDAFLHVESLWQRQLSGLGPLGGLERGLRAGWAGVLQLTIGPNKPYWTPSHPDLNALINVTGLLAVLVALAALPLVWRRFGPAWAAYTAVALLLPLSLPASQENPLLSMGRFLLALFPVFAAVATLRVSRRLAAVVGVLSGALLLAVVGWWTTGEFVA